MYDIEKIVTTTSIPEALAALAADEKAVVIAGGSDVLIKIREGKLAGCSLVSIHGIGSLKGVAMEADGTIAIGPGNTFSEVTEHPLIQKHLPALGEAVDQAGGPQLRNIGTIGGNICNGVTSADSAPMLVALNAQLEITSLAGVRRVRMEDFYAGPGKVHLAHGELLTRILIPKEDYEGFSGHYIKYAMRNAMDIATLGCAVHVRMEAGKIADVRLAFGVAGPVPMRCRAAEEAVTGREADGETLKLFGQTALGEVNPRTSWRASKEFRQQLVRELPGRALAQAIINGGGEAK
ncbi:MAG: xanthine dehydrogenase subunit XdhB [Candidatus Limiplasma sp.]|nr:xanthine dehydrogenase subunit XdhB [Candidatus Limiplasma sp.]